MGRNGVQASAYQRLKSSATIPHPPRNPGDSGLQKCSPNPKRNTYRGLQHKRLLGAPLLPPLIQSQQGPKKPPIRWSPGREAPTPNVKPNCSSIPVAHPRLRKSSSRVSLPTKFPTTRQIPNLPIEGRKVGPWPLVTGLIRRHPGRTRLEPRRVSLSSTTAPNVLSVCKEPGGLYAGSVLHSHPRCMSTCPRKTLPVLHPSYPPMPKSPKPRLRHPGQQEREVHVQTHRGKSRRTGVASQAPASAPTPHRLPTRFSPETAVVPKTRKVPRQTPTNQDPPRRLTPLGSLLQFGSPQTVPAVTPGTRDP